MSDVEQRTIFYFWDNGYLKFLPFCRVNIGGNQMMEPWSGLVCPQFKTSGVNFQNWNPKEAAILITGMEQIDPDLAASAVGGTGGDMPLIWGTPNTKVGK